MKPNISKHELSEFLIKKYGNEVDWEKSSEGMESSVLAFTWKGEEYILRVNIEDSGFKKDLWCQQRFSSEVLPIPEILEISDFSQNLAYCISRRLPGVTLENSSTNVIKKLIFPVSEAWNEIAQSQIPDQNRFGLFDDKGHANYSSWKEFLRSSIYRPDRKWGELFTKKILDAEILKPIMQNYLELTDKCPEERKLVHGDFGSNNMLTDGKKITGVLDWDCALYGDPLFDVAGIFFWSTWLECMQIQAVFFRKELCNEPNFKTRIKCYQLRCGLEEIYENVIEGNQEMLIWLIQRTQEVYNETKK